MSRNGKILGYGLGTVLLAGALVMCLSGLPGEIGPAFMGTIIIAALLLEPRYGRPRQTDPTLQGQWQRTGERFIDDESRRLVEVWYNPVTGERRYCEVDD